MGKIIFSHKKGIFEIAIDGGKQVLLTKCGGVGTSISPDGVKIVFMITKFKGWNLKDSKIFLKDINGEDQIKLSIEDSIDIDPSFSPDGKKIIFSSKQNNDDFEIYIMDIEEKKKVVKLTDNFLEDFYPKWSPDGGKIIFGSAMPIDIPEDKGYNPDDENDPINKAKNSSEIYIMDANGKNIIRLTNNSIPDGEPTWSPDSKKIAFVSAGELCIMDADGKNLINITKNNPQVIKITNGKPYSIARPCWSPDGKYISFILIGGRKTETNIYIISIDGKRIWQVTDLSPITDNIAWLPASPLDK